MKHVRIIQSSLSKPVVEIDGTDIAGAVRGLTVSMEVGEVTRVELDLCVFPVDYEGDAEIVVMPKSRDLLIAAGWTPPEPADVPATIDAVGLTGSGAVVGTGEASGAAEGTQG